MNHLNKLLFLFVCILSISIAYSTKETERETLKEIKTELNTLYEKIKSLGGKFKTIDETTKAAKHNATKLALERSKRQLAFGGGFGMSFGAYDYNDYYGEYVSDYAYDYYDWVCSDTSCSLCDILTSECCDPSVDINCFLPDSCFNNPCLSGGTCITTHTLDNQPDFICTCLPGLTGKYCQLVNDYFVGAELAFAPVIPMPPAQIMDQQMPIADQMPIAQQQMPIAQQQMPIAQQQMPIPQQPTVQAPTYQGQGLDATHLQQHIAQMQQQQLQQSQMQLMGQQGVQQQMQPQQQQQFTQNLALNSPSRIQAIQRKKCESGSIYSAEAQKCVNFTLAQRKK